MPIAALALGAFALFGGTSAAAPAAPAAAKAAVLPPQFSVTGLLTLVNYDVSGQAYRFRVTPAPGTVIDIAAPTQGLSTLLTTLFTTGTSCTATFHISGGLNVFDSLSTP